MNFHLIIALTLLREQGGYTRVVGYGDFGDWIAYTIEGGPRLGLDDALGTALWSWAITIPQGWDAFVGDGTITLDLVTWQATIGA